MKKSYFRAIKLSKRLTKDLCKDSKGATSSLEEFIQERRARDLEEFLQAIANKK